MNIFSRIWQRITWYPWRSQDEWIRSQEGEWKPWPEPRLDSYGKVSKERLAEIAAIPDKDIDYSDIPEAGEGWFKRAKLRKRDSK